MSDDATNFVEPADLGRHVVTCVERFAEQHPLGNHKNWEDMKRRLLMTVQRLPPALAFGGLLWVLEHDGRYRPQIVAGELLLRSPVACPLPPDELLLRVLPKYDLSAYTVPSYLLITFGKAAVIEAIGRVEQQARNQAQLHALKTIRYWLAADRDASLGMLDPLPTEEQRRALCEMIAAAFIEIRMLGWEGWAQQAADLADAFHNVPREMLGWGGWSLSAFRGMLDDYQRKYSRERIGQGRDFVSWVDGIFAAHEDHHHAAPEDS